MANKVSQPDNRVYYGLEMKVVKYIISDVTEDEDEMLAHISTLHDSYITEIMNDVEPELMVFSGRDDNALVESFEDFRDVMNLEASEEELMDIIEDLTVEYTFDDLPN